MSYCYFGCPPLARLYCCKQHPETGESKMVRYNGKRYWACPEIIDKPGRDFLKCSKNPYPLDPPKDQRPMNCKSHENAECDFNVHGASPRGKRLSPVQLESILINSSLPLL